MPQLLGLVLIGAGLVAGYRAFKRVSERMRAEVERAAEEARRQAEGGPGLEAKDLGRLELDPKSGVYRPRSE